MLANKKKCAVIGSGIAGLAAAIRLAQKGHAVTLFEKNSVPGGKLTSIDIGEYRFDFGPSLLTLPENIDELFTLCNKNPRDYFNFSLINPGHKYFYEDGKTLSVLHPKEQFILEAEKFFDEKPDSIRKYLEDAEIKYRLTKNVFLSKSLHKIKSYLSKESFKGLLNFRKLESSKTLDQSLKQRFRNPKTIQYFNRFATYNGSSPYKAPATLGLIPYLEIGEGVYYPEGGMHSITNALVKLAKEIKINFALNTEVKEIITKENKIVGIKTDLAFSSFDIVITNMDVYFTYHKLLPKTKKPEKNLSQEKSYSGVVFYWCINKSFPELNLHNILWSETYEKEFDILVNKKSIHTDPTIYLNITSKQTPTDAPNGCENWFVMINAPHLAGQDWENLVKELRINVVNKINRILKTDIESFIVGEKITTPITLEQKTSSAFGALYGNSSNNKYASFLRHSNFHSKIKGLYFCGGTVHPGGGIPLCLMSAKITTELID